MAKGKSAKEQRKQIEAQRRAAQAALSKNRVVEGGRSRSLNKRERAAYQRVITRSDELLGPASKPATTKLGAESRKALRTVKAFAERVRAGAGALGEIPEKMPK
jgi:hypothetical protein